MIKNQFPQLLKRKEHREHAIYSYGQVARDTGLSRSVIWRWQNGQITRIDPNVLDRLCVYLDCQPGDLLVRVEA